MVYGDEAEFSMYKFPLRASTYKVISGGWALYSEQDFKGKIMYHFGSKFHLMKDFITKDLQCILVLSR